MKLTGKTILILSPQSWGTMFISKHHYAVELAKRGNTVYYLNPPGEGHDGAASFGCAALGAAEGLFLVTQRLSFPGQIRFHLPGIFRSLMKRHLKQLLKFLPKQPDIIWNFDLNGLYDFNSFPSTALRIFHPVDEPLTAVAIKSAAGAQVIFSVTEEIIQKYSQFGIPAFCLNHGVASLFLTEGLKRKGVKSDQRLHIGVSGNLTRPDIDRPVLLQIIDENPLCVFEFWGAYGSKASNIGGVSDSETSSFIMELKGRKNVILHGPVSPDVLAASLPGMDLFLICYDVEKDQSKGTNYHKILEYVSTGKITVANNITTYAGRQDLVRMVKRRDSNEELPKLVKDTIGEIESLNSNMAMEARFEFARQNSYPAKLERIEEILFLLNSAC